MLTRTQGSILNLLKDGKYHTHDEIRKKCLLDDQADSFKNHLANLRKLLRPIGEDIRLIKAENKTYYQHVKSIPISEIEMVPLEESGQG